MFRSLSSSGIKASRKSASSDKKSLKKSKLRKLGIADVLSSSPAKSKKSTKKVKLRKSKSLDFASDHEESDSSDDRGRQNATWDKKGNERKSQKKRNGLVERAISVIDCESSSSGDDNDYIREYKAPLKGVEPPTAPPASRYDDDASKFSEESHYEPPPSYKQRSKAQDYESTCSDNSSYHGKEYGQEPSKKSQAPPSYTQERSNKAQVNDESSNGSASHHGKEHSQPSKSQEALMVDDDDGDSSIMSSDGSECRRSAISKASYPSVPKTSAMSNEQKGKEEHEIMIVQMKLKNLDVQEQLHAKEHKNAVETQVSYQRMADMGGGNQERGSIDPEEVQGIFSSQTDEMADMIQQLALETQMMENKLAEAEKEVAEHRTMSQVSLEKLAMLEAEEADEEEYLDDFKQQIIIADHDQHLADYDDDIDYDDDDASLDSEEEELQFRQRNQRPAKKEHDRPSSSFNGPSRMKRSLKPDPSEARVSHNTSFTHGEFNDSRAPRSTSATHGKFHDPSASWLSSQIASRSNNDDNDERAPDPPEYKTLEVRKAQRGSRGRPPPPAGRPRYDSCVTEESMVSSCSPVDDDEDHSTEAKNVSIPKQIEFDPWQRTAKKERTVVTADVRIEQKLDKASNINIVASATPSTLRTDHLTVLERSTRSSTSSRKMSKPPNKRSSSKPRPVALPRSASKSPERSRSRPDSLASKSPRGSRGMADSLASKSTKGSSSKADSSASRLQKRSSSKSRPRALSRSTSRSPERSRGRGRSKADYAASKSPKRSRSKAGSSALRRKVKTSESEGSRSKDSAKEMEKERERLLKKLEKLEKEASKNASLLERKAEKETNKRLSRERKLAEESSKRSLQEKKERKMTKERLSRALNGRPKKERESSPRDIIIGVPPPLRRPPKPVKIDTSVYRMAITPTHNFMNDKEMY